MTNGRGRFSENAGSQLEKEYDLRLPLEESIPAIEEEFVGRTRTELFQLADVRQRIETDANLESNVSAFCFEKACRVLSNHNVILLDAVLVAAYKQYKDACHMKSDQAREK